MMCDMSEMQHAAEVPPWTQGWRMRRALDHAGITVETMISDLGISRGTASRWLHDKGPVRDIYLKQWALRCGVAFAWLKDGTVGETYPRTNDQYFADSADFYDVAA
jgi:transcriptional regulator with XRE-family HTH domain